LYNGGKIGFAVSRQIGFPIVMCRLAADILVGSQGVNQVGVAYVLIAWHQCPQNGHFALTSWLPHKFQSRQCFACVRLATYPLLVVLCLMFFLFLDSRKTLHKVHVQFHIFKSLISGKDFDTSSWQWLDSWSRYCRCQVNAK